MARDIHILHLEDNKADTVLVRAQLKDAAFSFKLKHVERQDDYEEALRNWRPDVVLCDYHIPGYDAIEAYRAMFNAGKVVPFVVVTGVLTDEQAAKLTREGIDDYLLKDRLSGLAHTIETHVLKRGVQSQLDDQESLTDLFAERYRTLAEHSYDMVAIVDVHGSYLFVSDACKNILGYTPEEMIGTSGYDGIPQDEKEYIGRMHQLVLRKKQHVLMSHGMIRKDGSYVHVESSVSPVVDRTTGKLSEVIMVIRDVSEKRKARRKLDRANMLLTEAQGLAQVGNWNYDVRTNELHWSDSLKRLYGVSSEFEPDFEYFKSLIHPEDRDFMFKGMEKVQREGRPMEAVYRITQENGVRRTLRSKTLVERDSAGTPIRLFGIVQDVTDLEHARAEREKTLERLEQLVNERTAELTTKNKEVMDSIHAAERLIKAALPSKRLFDRYFQEVFIFHRPLNIIGGDFYWCHRSGKQIMLACVDCTGHGVPGAIMSLTGVELLEQMVSNKQWKHPSLILELLDTELENRLGSGDQMITDGMDMAFCTVDRKKHIIQFAGAMNPMVLVNEKGVRVFKGSRYSLGAYLSSAKKSFDTVEIEYEKGDMLYMFTDGYQDQFGGPNDKRFMFKQMSQMFENIHTLPLDRQKEEVVRQFDEWKGAGNQIDDVLLMGIRL